jgi:5-formyltetrahydrofolate cyclo-ligase
MQVAKQISRRNLKSSLSKQSQKVIQNESFLVAKKVFKTAEFIKSKSISIFLNSPSEISTLEIMTKALEMNKKVYIPFCDGKEMKMVLLSDMDDFRTLPRNSWGIPEPLAVEDREFTLDLDLVIMPGLGFDKNGNRIGFGKGYYDTFLAKCFQNAIDRGVPKPFTMAICLTVQIVDSVPVDANDIKPDLIITA